jgi:hypothetical protein
MGGPLTGELQGYLGAIMPAEPEALHELREESRRRPGHHRQVAPEQRRFRRLFVELLGVRRPRGPHVPWRARAEEALAGALRSNRRLATRG